MACTGCLVAQGFTPGCKRTPGGLQNTILIALLCEIEGKVTREGYDGTGKVSAIDPTVVWYPVTARQNTLNLTETRVDQAGSFSTQLTFVLEPQANAGTDNQDDDRQAAIDFITNLADPNAQYAVIITERSGVKRLLGIENGVFGADGFVADSGTVLTDVSNETVILTGVEREKAPVVSSDIVLTIAP